jgi:integrase
MLIWVRLNRLNLKFQRELSQRMLRCRCCLNYFRNIPSRSIQKPKSHLLYPNQAEILLTLIQQTSLYPYVLVALNTGARVSEIIDLNWQDIDWDNRTIKLHGKGDKERRVPIPDRLLEYLKEHRKLKGKICTGSERSDQVSKRFRHYADEIGLNEFTFHNLRDTYASWLVQNGTNLKVIQEILGHEDISTTWCTHILHRRVYFRL